MEAEIKIQDCPKPHAVVYTREITEEVKRVADYARQNADTLIFWHRRNSRKLQRMRHRFGTCEDMITATGSAYQKRCISFCKRQNTGKKRNYWQWCQPK